LCSPIVSIDLDGSCCQAEIALGRTTGSLPPEAGWPASLHGSKKNSPKIFQLVKIAKKSNNSI
jgi:hypothetical protein